MTPDGTQPDFATLADWLDGRLDPATAARVAEAVHAGDPRTLGAVAWLRGLRATAAVVPLVEPPPIVRQRLRQHFARWSQGQPLADRPRPVVAARLAFDSRRDLVQAGVRAADTAGDTVHLAFTADSADLVVDLRRLDSGRLRLDGQVLLAEPGQAPVFDVSASGGGFSVRTVEGDALGRFWLSELPVRPFELRCDNGELVLTASIDPADPADPAL